MPVHSIALWDDGGGADRLDIVEDGVGIVGFVSDNVSAAETGEQGDRMIGVVGLTSCQQEADRPAEAVDRDVPFAGQSSSGTPQSLVFDPPFWPVAA